MTAMNAVPRTGTTAVTAGQPLLTGGQTTRDYVLTLTVPMVPGSHVRSPGFLVADGREVVGKKQFGDRDLGRFFMRVDPSASARNRNRPAAVAFAEIAAGSDIE